jgi:N-acyl homoserine lactone hydrolase
VRVHVFNTGRVRRTRAARGVRRYFVDDWGDETLPVNVFVLEHPDGLCVIDAGQTAAAARPGYFPRWYPFFRLSRFELRDRDEAGAQLAASGFDLTRVRWVVLTHMHTDHVGGIGAFRGAEVVVARAEWDAAQGIRGRLRGYLPQRWPRDVRPRIAEFTGPRIGPFEASHDVAGDGRMLLVPLPGHSPGHAALLVRLSATRAYLFAGDAALRANELSDFAPAVADWCRREGIVVLTAHDDAARALVEAAERV